MQIYEMALGMPPSTTFWLVGDFCNGLRHLQKEASLMIGRNCTWFKASILTPANMPMRIGEFYEAVPLDEDIQVITGFWGKEIQYSIEIDSVKSYQIQVINC